MSDDLHESSCAVYNAPAYEPGPCDCKYRETNQLARLKVTTRWYLNDAEWDRFQEALNNPSAPSEKLRRLLNTPTVLDEERPDSTDNAV